MDHCQKFLYVRQAAKLTLPRRQKPGTASGREREEKEEMERLFP
jgi:hypothetical protein